jgi:NAD(P)H-hydrate epimerase
MKVFNTAQIRKIDELTIHREPIASIDLMERAAGQCVSWIIKRFESSVNLAIFTGPGHNGGDGLAIARQLADKGFERIHVYHLVSQSKLSADTEENLHRLTLQNLVQIEEIRSDSDLPELKQNIVVIDALFGSGLTRPLEDLPAKVVLHINQATCTVISIDIPSGLAGDGQSVAPDSAIIRATHTLTFEFPKRSFLYAENDCYVGWLHILPIGLHPEVIREIPADLYYTQADDVSKMIQKRKKFSHKGSYGHALLISGSYGMAGAAILASGACLRAGTGLLTVHIPENLYPIVQKAVPEAIFSIDQDRERFTTCPGLNRFSAIAAGPGIGTRSDTALALEVLIKTTQVPLVLDADALNLLAANPQMVPLVPANTILTPHPGEFARLFGQKNSGYERNELQREMSAKYGLIIVLKGAYTSVALPDGRCFFNSTGNPGMATAGSGDALTGVILALLAQGYPAEQAAIAGAFLHGLAGDLALEHAGSPGMVASDIVQHIGKAYQHLHI